MIEEIKQKSKHNSNTIFYMDPPYYEKGSSLYMNHYNDKQHKKIAEKMKTIKNIHWIVSYDDVSQTEDLYDWTSSQKYLLNHFAYRKKQGKEILFYNEKTNISDKTIGLLIPA